VNSPPSENPDQLQRHEQQRRGVRLRERGKANRERRAAHQRDREREKRAPADPVADQAENDAADRPRRKADGEHCEREKLTRTATRRREELRADVGREVAVDREVEPLEHVADEAGRGSAQ
jgi:hypothetical protein